ncbi:hypothetical protein V492_02333 [Pseudogymnoascus sp. VKM F-4246]|nr:hypothetical protein V492_02333 [Pseudogymnoascus sp. VKM F-4246]
MRTSQLRNWRKSLKSLGEPRNKHFHASAPQLLTHWEIERRKRVARLALQNMATPPVEKVNYKEWSHENLIKRVTELEHNLKLKNAHYPTATPAKSYKKARTEKAFDPSRYSTRLVAFKLAYLGKGYNGFEHHLNNKTRLPTVEEKIWEALVKARLIFPKGAALDGSGEINWDGCDYSKCGRTDKGVSAFGQVIGLRVRSNRPLPKHTAAAPRDGTDDFHHTQPRDGAPELASPALRPSIEESRSQVTPELNVDDPEFEEPLNFDPIADELPYCHLLNRLLPPDIRILAWCPAPPLGFSARFSCKERQYKYFFTQPAFLPAPENPNLTRANKYTDVKEGWLDIDAMREAASYFVGSHDFRNFCKIDGSKQITNFERTMFFADILEVDDTTPVLDFMGQKEFLPATRVKGSGEQISPKVYTFTLHGSAFLWHQVRCMVAILFLVGQGLEKPTIIKELLDVEKSPSRPAYEMAQDSPLVLWDCVFPHEDDASREDAIEWLHVGDERGRGETKWGTVGLVEDLWKVWRERKIDEVLASNLLGAVARQGGPIEGLTSDHWAKVVKSQKVYDGNNKPKLTGEYTPVMKKPLMQTAQVINEKYAVRKGFEDAADLKKQGFRRMNKPSEEVDADE